jgi:NAD(P)-dependent dehydrogenase (short-subunit alcohol dehydrogenase family)
VPDLTGKRILVTGGGTGLGKGLATGFAAAGAEVVIWGRRPGVLEEAAAEIGPGTTFASVDIRDADAVDAAVEEAWADGPITSLVNNAAANFVAPTKDLSARGFRAITSTVMDGAFHCTHSCGTRWIAEGTGGAVLSMLTTYVWSGSAFIVPSAMGKAAVHAMTMSLAVEWGRYGIRLNALAPGPFPTDFAWDVLSPGEVQAAATSKETVPYEGRFGRVEELQAIATFLLSDACGYLTGATIPVDGAQRLAAPNTFSDLRGLDDEAWAKAREAAQAAAAKAKAQQQP